MSRSALLASLLLAVAAGGGTRGGFRPLLVADGGKDLARGRDLDGAAPQRELGGDLASPDAIRMVDRAADLSALRPIAYWKLDEVSGSTAKDSSGRGHDGAVDNGTWVAGHRGGALLLVGAGAVHVPFAPDLVPGGAFTFAAWTRSEKAAEMALVKSAGADGWTSGWRVAQDGSPEWSAVVNGPAGRLYLQGGTVQPGLWQHLALVFDGQQATLFLDGNPVRSGPQQSPIAYPFTEELLLGASDGVPDYRGAIDEVYLFDSALDAASLARVRAGL